MFPSHDQWGLRDARDNPDSEHADFAADYMEAEAQAEVSYTDVIREEALENRNWQASAWWLGRRHKEYAAKQEVTQEVSTTIEGAPTIAKAREIMREISGGVTPKGDGDGEGV